MIPLGKKIWHTPKFLYCSTLILGRNVRGFLAHPTLDKIIPGFDLRKPHLKKLKKTNEMCAQYVIYYLSNGNYV